jgi:hypothetical protein
VAYSSQHHDHDDLLNATVDELVKRAKHASALEARLAEAQIALSNERQENQARSETVNDLEGELSLIRDQLSQDRKAQSEAARGDLRRLRDRLQKVEAASEAARDHHAAELGNAQLREDRLEERVREAHDHVEELTRKLEAARDQLAQERTHHERARSRLNERLAAAETAVLLERARQAHNTGDDWAAQTVPLL